MLAEKTAFVSVAEAAAIIGCTAAHVRRLLIDGTLAGQKLNERAWAVEKKSAERYARTPQTFGRPRISA